ncbi:hypothetical protein [Brevibacterium sp. ACRRH]|uniref:hypothetical protein n=1 Tax=Brevibacterium sp. ACRRH TaxID=2918183 RepID=UPI001EF3EC38|nr:hypothetical protein [Brevibacterium sp. ACRRH]MCG7298922.1 hypothetical protein [Brevibacterium sp. ACRRH]
MESLAFQGGIVVAISAVAYLAQLWFKATFPSVTVPMFSLASIFGLLVNFLFQKMKGAMLIDKPSMNSISGAVTDVLILCGIASVKPSVVLDHLVPLLILFAVGLAVVLFVGLVIAPRVLQENWFEKQIFSFGWATGAVPQDIALLRIVDPKLESNTLEPYALQGIANQNEILAVTFVPALVIGGLAWAATGIWGAVTVLGFVIAFALSRKPVKA